MALTAVIRGGTGRGQTVQTARFKGGGAGLSFTLAGVENVRSTIMLKGSALITRLSRGFRIVANQEMTEAKRRVPVDTGALRATGNVVGPFRSPGQLTVLMGFGGPAAPYARKVHEDLDAFHRSGQAKYLESTLLESAPFINARAVQQAGLG